MSEYSISIVPRRSSYPDAPAKAAEVRAWLVAQNVVEPTASDCVLSAEPGYAVAAGAGAVVREPQDLPFKRVTNGLELVTERRIFDNGGHGLEEIRCPSCSADIREENLDWLGPWADGESEQGQCPACGVGSPVHAYRFTPAWGFSNLGFTFWNWPAFTDEFLLEFCRRLDCAVDVVYQRL